jgi:hypothetical protein
MSENTITIIHFDLVYAHDFWKKNQFLPCTNSKTFISTFRYLDIFGRSRWIRDNERLKCSITTEVFYNTETVLQRVGCYVLCSVFWKEWKQRATLRLQKHYEWFDLEENKWSAILWVCYSFVLTIFAFCKITHYV